MKLKEYLQLTGCSAKAFAKFCGLSVNRIYFILDESREVGLKTAILIEKVTNGDVSILDVCDKKFIEELQNVKSPFRKLPK